MKPDGDHEVESNGPRVIGSSTAYRHVSDGLARLRRHDFVYLDAPTRALSIAGPHDAATRSAVSMWIDAGRPFVVRQQTGTDADCVALGLVLAPSDAKRRIALTVKRRFVMRVAAPPALHDVIDCVPPVWQKTLASLDRRSASIGVAFRVFGSVAWQALTGLRYVAASSDVDLLWEPHCDAELARGVALLEQWQHDASMRADCEIVFPGGDAVAWREWTGRSSHSRILVKCLDGTTMRSGHALLRTLEPADIDACLAG